MNVNFLKKKEFLDVDKDLHFLELPLFKENLHFFYSIFVSSMGDKHGGFRMPNGGRFSVILIHVFDVVSVNFPFEIPRKFLFLAEFLICKLSHWLRSSS